MVYLWVSILFEKPQEIFTIHSCNEHEQGMCISIDVNLHRSPFNGPRLWVIGSCLSLQCSSGFSTKYKHVKVFSLWENKNVKMD